MTALICHLVVFLIAASAACGQTAKGITLDAQQMPAKDAVDAISRQAGVSIVLDPAIKVSITASLNDADIRQALDVIAKPNGLEWRKLQFARPKDSTLHLDELKSAIVALASMSLVGISVEDPATGASAICARNLPAPPDTSAITLPEGYTWSTVYVVLPSGQLTAKVPSPTAADSAEVSKAETDRVLRLAGLTTEARQQVFQSEWVAQMSLVPEVRRQILRDRMRAMFSLDEQYRNELREDMRSVFQEMRGLTDDERGRGR